MTQDKAKQLATSLIDSEFDSFQSNPLEYCQALNWPVDSIATKKAIKNSNSIANTSEDIQDLTKVILDLNEDDTITVAESSKVNDFLVNCVSKHIVKSK